MNGLRLQKLEEVTIPSKQNSTALFFDIATQALGGFGLKKAPSFGMKKGGREGTESNGEIPCILPSPEVQYPKPEYEKEPFWTGGGSGCRAWSRRAF